MKIGLWSWLRASTMLFSIIHEMDISNMHVACKTFLNRTTVPVNFIYYMTDIFYATEQFNFIIVANILNNKYCQMLNNLS